MCLKRYIGTVYLMYRPSITGDSVLVDDIAARNMCDIVWALVGVLLIYSSAQYRMVALNFQWNYSDNFPQLKWVIGMEIVGMLLQQLRVQRKLITSWNKLIILI